MRITSRPLIQRILVWLVLLGAALISLFPMYWLFVMALTPIGTIPPSEPYLVPSPFSFSNIARLLTSAKDYGRWAVNSIVIAVVVTLWHTIFDTMSGYAFAKRDFPGRNVLFGLILSTLMIPAQVTLVPTYVVTRQLGLLESDPLISINGFQLLSVNSLAVILPGLAAVFGVFLMRQYIQTLPSELEDAARIDANCKYLQISSCHCVCQQWRRFLFLVLCVIGMISCGRSSCCANLSTIRSPLAWRVYRANLAPIMALFLPVQPWQPCQ